jgi:S1-C subfamily serine protease
MLQHVIASADPAVVTILCEDINSKGSGFLVSGEGHVVTNNHVVAELALQGGMLSTSYSRRIAVVIGGREYPATIANDTSDDRPIVYDYAILKVDGLGSPPFLVPGDPEAVRRGDKVVCLGFPLDFDTLIATDGIVSAVLRRPSHVNTLHEMRTIVSNALIQFGNSGGPMLDAESGKVIGINTLSHELRDVLRQRLETWSAHPSASDFSLLRDLVEYTLKYTYIGLNYAVSIEHVMGDPAWPR